MRFGSESQILADYESASRIREQIVTALRNGGVPYSEVNGLDFYCQRQRCPVVDVHGQFLLVDGKHISTHLAGAVADRVTEAILARRSASVPLVSRR